MLIVIATIVAALALSVGIASAGFALNSLSETDKAFDTMGSTGTKWSGATFNADRLVLLTVDDETTAYEFALDESGSIDPEAEVRNINLSLGRGDFEGVAWMSGETYAFLSEETGEVIVATVPAPAEDGTTTIDKDDIVSSFVAAPEGFTFNRGPEGIATDGPFFYVVNEFPATMTKFNTEGQWLARVSLDDLADASGVVVAVDGTYLVLSHESRVVAHYAVDWSNETATLLGTISVDAFAQAEGLALNNNTDLYVFGELVASSQTYSRYQGEVVAIEEAYSEADLNCSGDVTIADALTLAQVQVGAAAPDEACGNGDVNGDGTVDVGDVLVLMQCEVRIPNLYCPDV